MPSTRVIHTILGTGLWLAAAWALAGSIYTVRARVARPIQTIQLDLPGESGLAVGDGVFLSTDAGLEHIGEVREVSGDDVSVSLAVTPGTIERLTASANATCWRTPLGAEDAVTALLPPEIQHRIGRRIVDDWKDHHEQIAATWAPLAGELASAYLEAIGGDIEASFDRHEEELWAITQKHAREVAAAWPDIQEQLGPILERHLTPVLGRLMDDAVADAPKVSIGWSIARGKTAEAYQQMLDWLGEYLATMPENDKDQLDAALRKTWLEARDNAALSETLAKIGQGIVHDEELRETLSVIYREAVAQNPKTAEFFRSEILESQRVRKQMYAFIEAFAPTARRVLALCLFDDTGRTRPEVVHFIRSTALGRRVAWVTLEPGGDDNAPFASGVAITASLRGAYP